LKFLVYVSHMSAKAVLPAFILNISILWHSLNVTSKSNCRNYCSLSLLMFCSFAVTIKRFISMFFNWAFLLWILICWNMLMNYLFALHQIQQLGVLHWKLFWVIINTNWKSGLVSLVSFHLNSHC
jgi:hypothetical protein